MMMYDVSVKGFVMSGVWHKATQTPIARAESDRVYEIWRVVRETLLLSFVHWRIRFMITEGFVV